MTSFSQNGAGIATVYGTYLKLNIIQPQPFQQIAFRFGIIAVVLFIILKWAVKNFLFEEGKSDSS